MYSQQIIYQKTDKKVEKKFARGGNEGFAEYKKLVENENKIYHIMFIDTLMPEMNGAELTEKIRNYE